MFQCLLDEQAGDLHALFPQGTGDPRSFTLVPLRVSDSVVTWGSHEGSLCDPLTLEGSREGLGEACLLQGEQVLMMKMEA